MDFEAIKLSLFKHALRTNTHVANERNGRLGMNFIFVNQWFNFCSYIRQSTLYIVRWGNNFHIIMDVIYICITQHNKHWFNHLLNSWKPHFKMCKYPFGPFFLKPMHNLVHVTLHCYSKNNLGHYCWLLQIFFKCLTQNINYWNYYFKRWWMHICFGSSWQESLQLTLACNFIIMDF